MRKRDLSQLIYDSNKTLKKIDKASISFIYENEWYKLKNTFVLKRSNNYEEVLTDKLYIIIDIVNISNLLDIDKINYVKQYRYNQ